MKAIVPFSPSDFIVHEIDEDKNEADKFSTEIPPLPENNLDSQKEPVEPSKRFLFVPKMTLSGG